MNSKSPVQEKKRVEKQTAKSQVKPSAFDEEVKASTKSISGTTSVKKTKDGKHCLLCASPIHITYKNWSHHMNQYHIGLQGKFELCPDTNCQYQSKGGKSTAGKSQMCDSMSVLGKRHAVTEVPSYQGGNEEYGEELASVMGEDQNQYTASVNKVAQFVSTVQSEVEVDTNAISQSRLTTDIPDTTVMTATTFMQLLKSLESATEYELNVAVMRIQVNCAMFTNDTVMAYLQKVSLVQLRSVLVMIQGRSNQLKDEEILGMLIASILVGGACWLGAVAVLQRLTTVRQEIVFSMFSAYVHTLFGELIGVWFDVHWRRVGIDQLALMKAVRGTTLKHHIDSLLVSVVVTFESTLQDSFLEYMEYFCEVPAMELIRTSILERGDQPAITYRAFMQLANMLQEDAVNAIITENNETLVGSNLAQWDTVLDEIKQQAILLDSVSANTFLQELAGRYISITSSKLKQDLRCSGDDSIRLMFHLMQNKPNDRQFALAQYCLGIISARHRQLWVVPSGQGKSRIAATVVGLALKCQMFTTVHIVFSNQDLLERDRNDSQYLWDLLKVDDQQLIYHTSLGFKLNDNSLVIVDEADHFMLSDPLSFQSAVNGACCICFTATPDDGDLKGSEASVVKQLGFQQYKYCVQDGGVQADPQFDVIEGGDDSKKIRYLNETLKKGPVLLYCTTEFARLLTELPFASVIVIVQPGVDYSKLRQMEHIYGDYYQLAVSCDSFGMRGIDYRSKVAMTLVVNKSFCHKRDFLQGSYRVGRYGDASKCVRFADVELIDSTLQREYQAMLFDFATKMQGRQTTLKPPTMKSVPMPPKLTVSQPKTLESLKSQSALPAPQQNNSGAVKNIGLRQVQAAKTQTAAQQKFMKDFTTKNT